MSNKTQFQQLQKRRKEKNKYFESMYLDYFNNYLTVDKFADCYNITISKANQIINKGRQINHSRY